MVLTKYRIRELVKVVDEINNLGIRKFYGINKSKEFMVTNAKTDNLDERKYKLVRRNRFVYSGMQTGRDECIRISMFTSDDPVIVSPAYVTFEILDTDIVYPEYFFMIFLSKEKDRLGWFYSDSSIRANLDWEMFCDIEIDLPPIEIQEKYVAIYKAMLDNQKSYENGLEDLKLVCDATIERLRREMPSEAIGQYIEQIDERNSEGKVKLAQGVSVDLEFIDAKRVANNYKSCKIVHDGEFAYNKVMKANGTKFPIALRKGETCFISGSYQVFKVIDQNQLISEYLMMWLSRPEIQRYAGYISWGSTRDVLQWDVLGEIEIPIPDLHIQQSIVDIYNAYITRKKINERLKQQIKDICPILIAGAIKEANAIA